MTPREFIAKWSAGGPSYRLNERTGAQLHFSELCRLLGVEEPGDAERYCFERGLTKTGAAQQGYADVWPEPVAPSRLTSWPCDVG